MARPTDATRRLAGSLRIIAKQLDTRADQLDDPEAPAPEPLDRHQRQALIVIRAGLVMYHDGAKAERRAADWAANGLAAANANPGAPSTECSCDPDDPDVDCEHGTTTERSALADDPPDRDQWRHKSRRMRLERSLLVDNAGSYEGLVAQAMRQAGGNTLPDQLLDCANPNCGRIITRIGNDVPRRGRCLRCAVHLSRYDVDWPHRADPQDPDPDARPDADRDRLTSPDPVTGA